MRPRAIISSIALAFALAANAGVETATVTTPAPPVQEGFNMGAAVAPNGQTISLTSSSLLLNGKPWTPVMGEFHYSRYPENEWREELLKMKAGGIDIVATYVFWIHHEEVEGEWDWTGRRNLREFIRLAGEVGLKAIVRCGPWCHGEVRNGGQPDWLLKKGWKLRSDDPPYLDKARILYGQIAKQLSGLLWKDGGPVIGIQFENEYGGPASHLLTLKKIGREAGLDVPIYTRTGWPALSSPMPFGEIVPLYGVYAEGFWDREITPMPGRYWSGFHFSLLRSDANIANEILGRRNARDPADVAKYPYLTCEIGAGMMNSYHRRIFVYPMDGESTTLVKLGSGSTSPGYYMYHGGVNPEGKLTTLQESQATGYWNDMPVKNYDFQTALGEYGQVRPQYHSLRRLHLFLRDFGARIANMPATMPDRRPNGREDVETLRWSVRSDGRSGFVFVNNYERLLDLPAKNDVQFSMKLPGGALLFPDKPVSVPAGECFFWPFHFDLGSGVELAWATAQPLAVINEDNARTVFFAETPGVPVEMSFPESAAPKVRVKSGKSRTAREGMLVVGNIKPSRDTAIEIKADAGQVIRIVVLSDDDSLALWKGEWLGRERAFLTSAGLVIDTNALRLTSRERRGFDVAMLPAPEALAAGNERVRGRADGVFTKFSVPSPKAFRASAKVEKVKSAGPAREIPLGKISQPVAAAPEDEDFEKAAVWRIRVPRDVDLSVDPLLRLEYVGDVARVRLNGRLVTDDFYNGKPWEIGLRRHAPGILTGELEVAILPLRKDAPIYMAEQAKPRFGKEPSVAELRRVEIVPRYQVQLTLPR